MQQLKIPILLLSSSLFFFTSLSYAQSFGQSLCQEEGLHCKKIKGDQTWRSLFPKEYERDIVMRINRLNVQLYPGMVIAVPDDLENANIMDFAPFSKIIDPPEEKLIILDPVLEAWAAYDKDGSLVRWGPASSGSDYCRDLDAPCHTSSGSFRIFTLGSSDCYSTKFPLPKGGAPMPYCMYFHNGQALHGEPNGLPGFNASHGCVRLYVNDAEWLRYDFVEPANANNDYRGTRVVVKQYDNEGDEGDNNS